MQYAVIFTLAAFVGGTFASSSCYSEPVSLTVPPSLSSALSAASCLAPDIYSIGSVLSTVEFSSPSVAYAESVIASYEYSSPSVVSYLEQGDSYPSQVASSFYYDASAYSTLASAISTVMSAELIDSSLASAQSTLQSVMAVDSSITTDLADYTADVSPSIYSASLVIDQAAFTSPSIVSEYLSVYTVVDTSPSVSIEISSLSHSFYTLPSTVDSYVISLISSPSTMAPSAVSYLADCYSTVYSQASAVVSFTYYHPTVVSALTGYLSAASSVSSIGSAVYTVISQQMPTFAYQQSVIDSVASSWYSAAAKLDVLESVIASSPTVSDALGYLEQTFYDSPAVAYSLYEAIESPSSVTDTSRVGYEVMSHQSFVDALTKVDSFESAYTSLEPIVSDDLEYLTEAWTTQSTLLTAISVVGDYVRPSIEAYLYIESEIYSAVSSASTIIAAMSSAEYYSPSIACEESVILSYARSSPTLVGELWSVVTDVSQYTSSASYYASLEASYFSSLVSAIESLYGHKSSYPSLIYYETTIFNSMTPVYFYFIEYSSDNVGSCWFDSTLYSA